jgi:hypothetical protein
MEEALVSFEQKENYILVIGRGERNDFISIMDGTKQINEAVKKFKNPYFLLDYRDVRFNIPITNLFDAVRVYETKMPDFKNINVAVVLSEINLNLGKYWKDIVQQRGFNFMVFDDLATAELWLLEQKKKA